MDYNPESYESASARFLMIMITGVVLTVIMLSVLADMVTGAGMLDKLMSAIGVGSMYR